jgi:hypothetical protein
MRRKRWFFFPLLLLGLTAYCDAQLWSGILDPSRAADWSQAGVPGGIPTRGTQCGATIAVYSGSASAINNAISSCPAGQYVSLGTGTFKLSSGILLKSNVTLRGQGADQTFLVFTGHDSCGGWNGDICIKDANGYYYGGSQVAPGQSNAATWSGGYAQGATSITLTNVGSSGISVGQYIYLDQANDTSDHGGFLVCDDTTYPCSLEGGAPGRTVGGVHRNQIQAVKVTAINGNTYTITPGLYGKNWASGKNPGAWWSGQITGAGVENLSIDHANSGGTGGIVFLNAFESWVKGVRSLNANRNHIWFMQAAHNTVQDSYFYGTLNAASQSYGVESFISSDNLAVNNIFQHVTVPIMMGPSMGSVFAFNFSINDFYYVSGWLMQSVYGGHDAGVLYNLFEGNNGAGFMGDVFHGSSNANTVFRNRFTGWESGKSGDTVPVQFYSYNRYMNVVGNVLGTSGYHTTYQSSSGTGASKVIYDLTSGNTEGSVTVRNDPYVATSLMRWGNYDVVNNAVRWVNSEVPSGLSDGYANPVPANQNLPTSFYTSGTPGWWGGAMPWPAIGPDVTGGNIPGVGGHAYLTPAANCYLNVMGGSADGTGNALSYNPSNCYTTGNAPPPPGGLKGVAH